MFQLLLGSACTVFRFSQFLTLQSQWVDWVWARGWVGIQWGQLTQVGQSTQDPRTQNSSLAQFISPGWIDILAPPSYWAVKCCKKAVWTNRVFFSSLVNINQRKLEKNCSKTRRKFWLPPEKIVFCFTSKFQKSSVFTGTDEINNLWSLERN